MQGHNVVCERNFASPVSCLQFSNHGEIAAVGLNNGELHLVATESKCKLIIIRSFLSSSQAGRVYIICSSRKCAFVDTKRTCSFLVCLSGHLSSCTVRHAA